MNLNRREIKIKLTLTLKRKEKNLLNGKNLSSRYYL